MSPPTLIEITPYARGMLRCSLPEKHSYLFTLAILSKLIGDIDMKCPMCGRRAGWARTRCPACRTKLIQWYIIATILFLVACFGFLLTMETLG
jgi:hypothetical protein